jgi:hypothetical protein
VEKQAAVFDKFAEERNFLFQVTIIL